MANAVPTDPQLEETGEYPTLSAVVAPEVVVRFGALSDPGRVRDRNEDQYLVAKLAKSMRVLAAGLPDEGRTHFADEEGYLFLVADGLGGEAAGELASAEAVRTVEDFMLNTVKWFLHLGSHEEHAALTDLKRALERADRVLIERARAESHLAGMSTTMTLVYSVGTDLFVVHAGDSRAYLLRRGELTRLTTDHTLVQVLVDSGAITPEDARSHPRRNVVLNALGGPREGVETELLKLQIEDGDAILLCSDGLTEVVPDPAIAHRLITRDDPASAARALVDDALEAGGPDNVTVVVARFTVR